MNIDQLMAQGLQSLDEVKAGDWLLLSTGSYSHRNAAKIVQVDRVTKTQIIIGTTRYSRNDGYEVGGSKWLTARVHVATERLVLEVKIEQAKRELRAMAERVTVATGILTGNASVTAKTLEQVNTAHNQLQAVLATLEGGNA